MSSDPSDYAIPPKGKTPVPTMTVAAVIAWLDNEIEDLKAKQQAINNETMELIYEGTILHLELMKAQITDHSMNMLDEYHRQNR